MSYISYQVTVCVDPTVHMVFASGLVMGGLKTSREVNGMAWTRQTKSEKHEIVKVNIIVKGKRGL